MKKGQYQDALGKYTECLKLKPEECAVYTNRLVVAFTFCSSLGCVLMMQECQKCNVLVGINDNRLIHYLQLVSAAFSPLANPSHSSVCHC